MRVHLHKRRSGSFRAPGEKEEKEPMALRNKLVASMSFTLGVIDFAGGYHASRRIVIGVLAMFLTGIAHAILIWPFFGFLDADETASSDSLDVNPRSRSDT